ncbi:MAG: hypothetical protein U5R31_08790 [Acidimicrobiia bacterium]|nr:hypothetical protein [Acidimicrobiia bacterium]
MADHQHDYYLGAVFEDHRAAEQAIDELRRVGTAEDHLGIVVREPHGHDGLGEAVDAETAHATGEGIAVGVPVGMLGGMAIMAIAASGGVIGLGGALVAGAAAGLTGGAFFGGALGLATDRAITEEEAWEDLALDDNEVLVAVHPSADRDRARAVLERHGGRVVTPGEGGVRAHD